MSNDATSGRVPTSIPVQWPAGPPYQHVVGAGVHGWVRYKLFAAQWYIDRLKDLRAVLPEFDRYIGVEMALDGALSALVGAWDAAVGGLIQRSEARLGVTEAERAEPHAYDWRKCKKLLGRLAVDSLPDMGVKKFISDVDEALRDHDRPVAKGWLARLRRDRNRPTHHGSVPRVFNEVVGGSDAWSETLLKVHGAGPQDAADYLTRAHSQVRELCDRALAIIDAMPVQTLARPHEDDLDLLRGIEDANAREEDLDLLRGMGGAEATDDPDL